MNNTDQIDAVHILTRAASHIFADRCPEHWQGHDHLNKPDKAAINILDYIANRIRREWRIQNNHKNGGRCEHGPANYGQAPMFERLVG